MRCWCFKFNEVWLYPWLFLIGVSFKVFVVVVVCACLKRELFEHHKLAGGRPIFLVCFRLVWGFLRALFCWLLIHLRVMCGCRFKVVILVLHTCSNHQLSLRLFILKNTVCVTVLCLLMFLVTCNLRINHFIKAKEILFSDYCISGFSFSHVISLDSVYTGSLLGNFLSSLMVIITNFALSFISIMVTFSILKLEGECLKAHPPAI